MEDLKKFFDYYPNCLESVKQFKSSLMEYYPSQKRKVNILVVMYECGMIESIKESINKDDIDDIVKFVEQLEDEYGIAIQYSYDIILDLKYALKSMSEECNNGNENEDREIVIGNPNEYDIYETELGYYITKFKGFEEEEMTIPNMINGCEIVGIAKGVYKGCLTVKKINVSEGIKVIGSGAFQDCKSLENIKLPNSLVQIGSIIKEYEDGAFSNTNLKEVTIPPNVKYIGANTFSWCENLKKVEMSNNIEVIYAGAFRCCGKLEEIIWSSNLVEIGEEAFYGCDSLHNVKIPDGIKILGRKAFYDTFLESIYIPKTVTKIGDNLLFYYSHSSDKYTIYCEANSVAMEYARKNNIKCKKADF